MVSNLLFSVVTFHLPFRLFKDGCRKLKYLDVSGCPGITDKSLVKLSTSIGKITTTNTCASCTCAQQPVDSPTQMRQLETLRVSGCYKITDTGLRYLD